MPPPDKWYSIRARAATPRITEVLIYGDIGESWSDETVTAADFVREISALDVDEITVRINSLGGSVPDGLAIHNALRRHKASVTVAIDGMAMSIASLIAMAGDTIEMAENAILMIHAPWTYAVGNAGDLREFAETLDKWAIAMSTSYAAKTGHPQSAMLALLTDGVDHYYTAAEAKEAGFVDEIVGGLPIAAALMPAAALARFRTPPAAAGTHPQEKSMTAPTPAAAPQPTAQTEESIRAAALAADKQRRTDIGIAFAKFGNHAGVPALQATCQEDYECTAAAAGQKLLAHLGKDATPVAAGHVVTVEDERDKFRAAAVESLMARAAMRDAQGAPVRAAASNPYRGHKLLDLARACLTRAGIRIEGMGQMELVAAAFTQSTSDFPVLLENAMHKTLQQAYATAADTWTRFCAVGAVTDFRAHPRYRVGSLGNLDALNELGEYKNKTIPDGEKATITAATKGNVINLSRQMIVNDDLGAFIGLAAMLGRAAKRTIEADVYTLLALNSGLGPTMADGLTLFHANHGNIGATGAISVDVIDDARVKLASQKDISSNDYLDLRPAVLLCAMGTGGNARVINDSQYDPDTANKLQRANKVRGLFRDVVDTPRLTGTRFYTFADPSEAPVIEVAFLDGVQDPFLEMQDGFDVDGARYKVRLDFGIAAIDYRGAVTSAGA